MKQELAAELRRLLDRTAEIRSSLRQLDRPVETWDDVFVNRTVGRLEAASRRDWEKATNREREPVSWEALVDFLASRLRELEAVDGGPRSSTDGGRGALLPGSANKRGHSVRTHHVAEATRRPCAHCRGNHPLWDCAAFKRMAAKVRRERVIGWGLCYNCLSPQHQASQCFSGRRCRECGQPHHTLIHREEENTGSSTPGATISATVSATSVRRNWRRAPRRALLATARVRLSASNGRSTIVRALIDTGAEVNLVSESVVQRLRAGRRAVRMELAGAAETPSQVVRAMTTLRLSLSQGEECKLPLEALVLPRLTAYKPPLTSIPRNWTHLEGLSLADDVTGLSRIDAVLGADIYASIIRPELRRGVRLTRPLPSPPA
ncbi:uncharacterized protein LOC116853725 [Odontomachus brunneus]|uniref:uncharacterized protein LOC116853725 n=1 Tax=Odontomachus brunneus TaxID=486640 RepID=UPI0013F223CE|nr:uncharacterized protein LOC116853725 [Odontomachus brunneus]